MGLHSAIATKTYLFSSAFNLYLSLVNDTTGAPVTGQSPTIAIRRVSDGFFFNGTAFINTSGTPTNIAMTEVSAVSNAGLYRYTMTDPGPIVPTPPALQIPNDIYELRYVASGSPPVGGTMHEIISVHRKLRDVNTQGS